MSASFRDVRPTLDPVFRVITQFTVDDNCGGGAASLGHDVLSHTGVVGGVGEAGLLDDQVVVNGDVEVPVVCGINNLLILQPLHLERRREHAT